VCSSPGIRRPLRKRLRRRPGAVRPFAPGIPDTAERLGFRRRAENPHASHGGGGPGGGGAATPGGFSWTLPEGWKDLPPKQFRQGNWSVDGQEDVQAYLTVGTGGGILLNVNRWRSQMGLEPVSDAEVKGLSTIEVLGRTALIVELDGTFAGMGGTGNGAGYRMLGVIFSDDRGGLVFLKMFGPKAKVEKAHDAFLALVGSLRPTGGSGGMPPTHGDAATRSGLQYVVPEGWRKGKDRQMREVTFHPGEGTETECYVTVLSAAAADVAMNVNMWRGQMSETPLSADAIKALPAVEVLGRPSQWVEITGTYRGKSAMGQGVEMKPGYRMFALLCAMPRATITVKMVGPDKVVLAEKQNFLDFCRSLHL